MDEELFALLIGAGTKGSPVQQVSQALLKEAGSLATMATWEAADFARVRGLGPAKAAELSAVMELARRIRERAQDPGEKLDAPLKVWARMEPLAAGLTVEKCWVLCLNRRNRLLALHEVSSGTATSALLHPREVFRQALRHGRAHAAGNAVQQLGLIQQRGAATVAVDDLGGAAKVQVNPIEILRTGPSYAIDTVEAVAQTYPDDTIVLVVGQDAAEKLDQWHRIEDLRKMVEFLIIARPGHAGDGVDIGALDVAATTIRQGLSADVSSSVAAFIRENNLYDN